jgi:hypothetical protein
MSSSSNLQKRVSELEAVRDVEQAPRKAFLPEWLRKNLRAKYGLSFDSAEDAADSLLQISRKNAGTGALHSSEAESVPEP